MASNGAVLSAKRQSWGVAERLVGPTGAARSPSRPRTVGVPKSNSKAVTFSVLGLLLGSVATSTATTAASVTNPPVGEKAAGPQQANLAFFINVFHGQMGPVPQLVDAVYHPENFYVLHLDAKAADTPTERMYDDWFRTRGPEWENVEKLLPARRVNYSGVSMLDVTLSAISLLLGMGQWSYFINLCPYDYPLLPPDAIRHAIGQLPEGHLSFVSHANGAWHEGERWWAAERLSTLAVDNSLYMSHGSEVKLFHGSTGAGDEEKRPFRELPTAFDVYRGDPWVILGRVFAEYLLLGTDGWARRALLYFSNTVNPLEHYFPTVLCNSEVFRHLVVRDSLRLVVRERQGNFTDTRVASILSSDLQTIIARGQLFAVLPTSNFDSESSRDVLDSHLQAQLNNPAKQGQTALKMVQRRLQFVLGNSGACDWASSTAAEAR